MAFGKDHELHTRRLGRNAGVALALVGFAVVIFGITVVKILNGGMMQAYDHQPRATILPVTEGQP